MSDVAEPFVLDRDSNPHPKMLEGALEARIQAKFAKFKIDHPDTAYWQGYLQAMADATGCTPIELQAWMDAHEAKR